MLADGNVGILNPAPTALCLGHVGHEAHRPHQTLAHCANNAKVDGIRVAEVIGADISPDMLAVASGKDCPADVVPPIYICQPMEELDLFGTIDAAVCCLDGVGYVTDKQKLARAFSRVRLFMNPGGAFIFDVNSPSLLRALDGCAFTREDADAFCVYQGDFSAENNVFTYTLDLFEKQGRLYRRTTEYHRERAYEPAELEKMLLEAGFSSVEIFGDRKTAEPTDEDERIYLLAKA